jgi:hypothetical protein
MFSIIDVGLAFVTGINLYGFLDQLVTGRKTASMWSLAAVVIGTLTIVGGALV